MLTQIDPGFEPLGVVLARCYRLARERAHEAPELRESINAPSPAPATAIEDESSGGSCTCAQLVIQSLR